MIIKTDPDTLQNYLSDASNYRGSSDKVYIPENTSELQKAVAECYFSKTPFTISGAGTGLTGARVADKGAMISTELLNRIIEIDETNLTAKVQPGVLLSELESELNNRGYFFPPNPTEKNSSIGGNIAVNASGSRTFKYGSYRNFVKSLHIILPNSDEAIIERGKYSVKNDLLKFHSIRNFSYGVPIEEIGMPDVKNASGYYMKNGMDAIDLFIGNEGTLSVIAEAELRFLPLPEKVLGLIVFFDSTEQMLNFIDETRKISKQNNLIDYTQIADISARSIELFDKNALGILRNYSTQIPPDSSGAVWIEQEMTSANEDKILSDWFKMIEKFTKLSGSTWTALNDKEHSEFRELRHKLPLYIADLVQQNGFRKVGTDTAVPDDKFTGFYLFVDNMMKSSGIKYAIWSHAGNAHLHANMLPANEIEFNQSLKIFDEIIRQTFIFGGTVSAEHGIGKLKKQYLLEMYGESSIESMKMVKKVLDPYNLMGRGNVFD